ncbi:MAG: hypothetical protein ACI8ZN_000478 [Bacteroidia bacterium]|jgi:hypothetical protein
MGKGKWLMNDAILNKPDRYEFPRASARGTSGCWLTNDKRVYGLCLISADQRKKCIIRKNKA